MEYIYMYFYVNVFVLTDFQINSYLAVNMFSNIISIPQVWKNGAMPFSEAMCFCSVNAFCIVNAQEEI